MDLRDYEQYKFKLADLLRAAAAAVPENDNDWRKRLQDAFARLAEDRFNLVVVGRFSRGKTSLMNAILDTDRLPTGITPLTSVITSVGYGSKEQVVLKYDERILTEQVPISALPRYITQQGNPGNIQRIKAAEVQLPAEILRRGFYFVDTPGLGSVIAENTLTTEAFLPEADAFLLVTSYESPLSEEELRFFKAASASHRRVFVVLNKHDMVRPEERETAIDFVRTRLRAFFGDSVPALFSVSAKDGLDAKRAHSADRLAASGIPALEQALVAFLIDEKSTEFLLSMCDRVRLLITDLLSRSNVGPLLEHIDTLARQIAGDHRAISADMPSLPTALFPNLHRLHACEICAHIAEELWEFLRQYQYELIVSHDEQQRFADAGGFCSFHTWEYEAIATPYGICAGYPALLDRLAAALRTSYENNHRLLPTEDSCPLCKVRNDAEAAAVDAVAKRLNKEATTALQSLSAICLPHLTKLSSAVRSELRRPLAERQAAILERIAEDMHRYALKHDAVRRFLESQEETTAAQRALLFLSGRRTTNFAPARRPDDTTRAHPQQPHRTSKRA